MIFTQPLFEETPLAGDIEVDEGFFGGMNGKRECSAMG